MTGSFLDSAGGSIPPPPNPLHIALEKGRHFLHLGRFDDAEREFLRGLAIEPHHPRLRYEFARCFLMQDELEEAEKHVVLAIQCAPEWAPPHGLACLIHAAQGRFSIAEQAVLEGLRLDPTHAWLYETYGRLLYQTGHLGKAESLVRKSLEIDPDDGEAHGLLSVILAEKNEKSASLEHGQTGLKLAPTEDTSHLSLGLSYLQTGHPFQAREHLREALRLDPTDKNTEELFLDADRACRWIYLPMYLWTRLITRLPGQQFGIWAAFIVFVQFGPKTGLSDPLVDGVIYTYIAFCIYTWFSGLLARTWIKFVPPKL